MLRRLIGLVGLTRRDLDELSRDRFKHMGQRRGEGDRHVGRQIAGAGKAHAQDQAGGAGSGFA